MFRRFSTAMQTSFSQRFRNSESVRTRAEKREEPLDVRRRNVRSGYPPSRRRKRRNKRRRRHGVDVIRRNATESDADAQTSLKSSFPSNDTKSNGSTSGTRLRGNVKSRLYLPPLQAFVFQSFTLFRNAPKFGARRTFKGSTAKVETTEPNATR